MTKQVILLSATLLMILAALAGCSGGGATPPAGPVNPSDDVTILYCRVVEIDNLMRVQWLADAPTRGELRYGRTSYTSMMEVPALRDSHDIALPGLAFNTRYIYRITVTDSAGHTAECDGDFTTPVKATPEPVISGLAIEGVTESTARVSWYTDEPATTVLYYGHAALTDSIVYEEFDLIHEVMIAGLNPSTGYLLRAEAVDTSDLRGFGPDTSLVTAARMMLSFGYTVVPLGDTVDIPIQIADATDLAALRFALQFQPGSVEVVSITEGPFYTGRRGFIFFSDVRNSTGRIFADLTWSMDYEGGERVGTDADGDGIVAIARVRGLSEGSAAAQFIADSSFALDMFAVQHACSLAAGSIVVQP